MPELSCVVSPEARALLRLALRDLTPDVALQDEKVGHLECQGADPFAIPCLV
jgi:hypothetical protein